MALYTFRHKDTGSEKEVQCSFSEYEAEAQSQAADGYYRVFEPVFVKDSGSGRG